MDIKALAAMLEQAEDPGDKYTGPKASPGSALPPDPATLEAAKVEQSAVARALARKRGQLVGNEPGRGGGGGGGGGASSSATTSTSSTAKSTSLEAKNSKDIWDVDEVPSSAAELLTNEHVVSSSTSSSSSSSSSTIASSSSGGGGRLRPKFDILFKQKIGTEEVFLGVSGTTPLSSHCSSLLVKVELPGATMKDVELDVTDEGRFMVSTGTFLLNTFLPMKVVSKQGSAKFDSKEKILSVTLPIQQSEIFGTSTSQ
jgi:hypothetical protein